MRKKAISFRVIGHDARPIFVSESGIASQPDPMGEYLAHAHQKLSVAITLEEQKKRGEGTEAFWDFYALLHTGIDLWRIRDRQRQIRR